MGFLRQPCDFSASLQGIARLMARLEDAKLDVRDAAYACLVEGCRFEAVRLELVQVRAALRGSIGWYLQEQRRGRPACSDAVSCRQLAASDM
jgi:hypothetical protein